MLEVHVVVAAAVGGGVVVVVAAAAASGFHHVTPPSCLARGRSGFHVRMREGKPPKPQIAMTDGQMLCTPVEVLMATLLGSWYIESYNIPYWVVGVQEWAGSMAYEGTRRGQVSTSRGSCKWIPARSDDNPNPKGPRTQIIGF